MPLNADESRRQSHVLEADWRLGTNAEPSRDGTCEREPDGPEPADGSDLDDQEIPCTDDDDSWWEAFIPDDDEYDSEPEPGDFWIEHSQESRVESQEPERQSSR